LLQAEFARGVRSNPALRRELPAYDPATWQMEPSRGST
jgi:hypothetical protein